MRILLVLFFIVFLSCKAKDSSSSNEPVDKPQPPAPASISPDQCSLIGTVVIQDKSGASVVVEKIVEKGFSFNSSVFQGDTVFINGLMDVSGSINVVVESTIQPGNSSSLQIVKIVSEKN